MSISEKITNLKRTSKNADIKDISYNNNSYKACSFYCLEKIVLSDEISISEWNLSINRSLNKYIQAIKNLNISMIYIIRGDEKAGSVSLSIGVNQQDTNIKDIFRAFFRDVQLNKVELNESFEGFTYQSLITGIPFIDYSNSKIHDIEDYIGSIIRFIKGKNAVIEIIAKPLKDSCIDKQLDYLMNEKTENSEKLKISHNTSTSKAESDSSSKGTTRTEGSNQGAGIAIVSTGSNFSTGETSTETNTSTDTEIRGENVETIDAYANMYDELLEKHRLRLLDANSSGLWQTLISVSAEDEQVLSQISSILSASYETDAVESFEIHKLHKRINPLSICRNNNVLGSDSIFDSKYSAFSFLTGKELALLLDLPKEEYSGYRIESLPRFSQNAGDEAKGFEIGKLYDGESPTEIDFKISNAALSKHLMVAGITGSGKTNTVFNLLNKINVPFLVIEPAKKEYRNLATIMPNIRVYTLGDENTSPFRLNPFYFGNNVNIQQHIDNLKVIFNASFSMYASMPNILEQCLNNIYIKKGWSLTASENIFQKDGTLYPEHYPTIEDLYYEIDDYMDKLGYAKEQTQNIRAALLTRIKSLMTGGKGFMLNTTETIDMQELLNYPTVLELDSIADDDEKSLIIGFIAMNIYEHLKSTASDYSGTLKYLLVFEEAHRIFTNVSQNQNQEIANIRGKAVENLSNILCEVRAYGAGMLIIDQVPIKLAPDVLKNTNTKIIHRLVSRDDCEYVARSLGLDEEKTKYISRLKNGSALIYSDDMDLPVNAQINLQKSNLNFYTDKDITDKAGQYNTFVNVKRNVHPLTDLLMQQNPLEDCIQKAAEILYRNLLTGEIKQIKGYISQAKKEFIDYAHSQGFDTSIRRENFVNSLIEQSLNYIVKKDRNLNNNLNKSILTKRFIEACLEVGNKNYESNLKEYKMLELGRRQLV